MNLENILAGLSGHDSPETDLDDQHNSSGSAPRSLASHIPGGVAGGLAAGGVMALLLGSKSTRKMTKKVAKIGGTAVLGGLAFKAYDNWQKNKALGQTRAITEHDIDNSIEALHESESTDMMLSQTLIKAMIAAAKSDDDFDSAEQKKLFDSVEAMNLGVQQKAEIFELMNRDIEIQELTEGINNDEHKAEVYLAAYLAISVDDQRERVFLNNLATALNLPRGFTAYLEQQADLGVES